MELLQLLLADADAAVTQAAQGTLGGIPVDEMLPILKDRETPAVVLSWAVVHREERELREVVLQNSSLPDEAVEALAGSLPEHLAELVVINQVRLLRRTSLLEVLESNAALNKDQRRRLRELRETFRIGEQPAPAPPPPPPPPPPPAPAPEEAAAAAVELSQEQAIDAPHRRGEAGRREAQRGAQLYSMNTAEKVIRALKGTSGERAILVRDPNRIVASAVLGSPRLTDPEIERFAAMKNVSEEILRQIAQNKDWTKRYGVIAALVKNPRTPIGLAINFIPRMNPRDMKTLAVDKGVPEVIRKQAKKFVKEVGGGGGGGGGSKH